MLTFSMADKITPNDPRVQYKSTTLNGVKYGYILAEPQGQPINTVFLIRMYTLESYISHEHYISR